MGFVMGGLLVCGSECGRAVEPYTLDDPLAVDEDDVSLAWLGPGSNWERRCNESKVPTPTEDAVGLQRSLVARTIDPDEPWEIPRVAGLREASGVTQHHVTQKVRPLVELAESLDFSKQLVALLQV